MVEDFLLLGILVTITLITTGVILSYIIPWVKFQIFKVDKDVDKVTRWHKED